MYICVACAVTWVARSAPSIYPFHSPTPYTHTPPCLNHVHKDHIPCRITYLIFQYDNTQTLDAITVVFVPIYLDQPRGQIQLFFDKRSGFDEETFQSRGGGGQHPPNAPLISATSRFGVEVPLLNVNIS